jgi:hypothetical protein
MPSNYVLLERIELNASAASVVFSNIPQTGYTDLKIVVSARSDRSGARGYIGVYFNGSFTNQTNRRILGDGASASSSSETNNWSFIIPGASQTASTFGNAEVYIPNYNLTGAKSFSVDGVQEANETTAFASLVAALTTNTAAITSVTIQTGNSDNFVSGSTFSLYGLAAVGTTPVIAPKASGGNIIDYDGTYWIHTFLTSGTFTPQTSLSCDYLVVAGAGGGGGGGRGGGGGAGGYLTSIGGSPLSVAATAYAITVGAGGAGVIDTRGASGSNSIFSSVTSTGGGGGGGRTSTENGANGGSGGGAATGAGGAPGTAGSASPSGQGNNGGPGSSSAAPNYGAGGGGGAGAVGGTGTSLVGGNGGVGLQNSITGTSTYYAGGGGGGAWTGNTASSSGGLGGGGAGRDTTGGVNANGDAGTTNTGGGGGASSETGKAGGNGGSGIVIIRYLA